jgi:hypothetical protein
VSDFNVNDQTTAAGNINAPSSGSYGEGAALDRLKQALPQAAPSGPGAAQGAPIAPLPRTSPAATPQGGELPPALLRPSGMPDVPQTTPLAQPPVNPVAIAQTAKQQRLAILDALEASPMVSEYTRELAGIIKDRLIRASVQ